MNQRQRTIETVEVKEDTIEEIACIHCDQWYEVESNELMPMQINEDFEVSICKYCADSMYEYETQTSLKAFTMRLLDDKTAKDLYKGGVFVGLGILTVVTPILMFIGLIMMDIYNAIVSLGFIATNWELLILVFFPIWMYILIKF